MCKQEGENPSKPYLNLSRASHATDLKPHNTIQFLLKKNKTRMGFAIPRSSKERKCYGQTTLKLLRSPSLPWQAGLVISSEDASSSFWFLPSFWYRRDALRCRRKPVRAWQEDWQEYACVCKLPKAFDTLKKEANTRVWEMPPPERMGVPGIVSEQFPLFFHPESVTLTEGDVRGPES